MFKKGFVLLFFAIFLITGCSNQNSDMYEVNQTDVTEKLDNIDFEYKLPMKMPFEVESTQINQPPTDQSMFSVAFYGVGGEYLFLDVSNSDVKQSTGNQTEEVSIDNLKGTFLEHNQGAKVLFWKENEVTYQLSLKESGDQDRYSKEDLIKIAESFE
ncbi:protein of unknown function [Salinibacillus kushneri]|uniref:DUF4367 domain-containing protein n=1 Tax=Salinibacillus kushneri TaxID=237682 RepID=A0A1I0F2R1_9BACI|nr:DUF4367 domain-containing protein [Salinibacillus kushneri]SET52121.1 protein of unknown function [Salinibacillus kushneri]